MLRRLGYLMLSLSLLATGKVRAEYGQTLLNAYRNQNSAAIYSGQRTRNLIYKNAVPQYNYSSVNRNVLNPVSGSPATKPFAGRSQGPSVSPYLGLTSPYSSSASNYYTLVRPQLEQQRINEQMEQRNIAMQRQLNSVTARPPYELKGESDQMPTGHQTTFMNTLGYYPQVQSQQRR